MKDLRATVEAHLIQRRDITGATGQYDDLNGEGKALLIVGHRMGVSEACRIFFS